MPGEVRKGPEGPGVTRGEPPGESLPASHRLRRRSEIKRVQERGQRFGGAALLVLLLPNSLGYRRVGVTVSSKVGNAVRRNQVKRWFREIFRKRRALLPPSMDVVMIARSAAAGAGLAKLDADFRKSAEQARRRHEKPAGVTPGEGEKSGR